MMAYCWGCGESGFVEELEKKCQCMRHDESLFAYIKRKILGRRYRPR